MRGFPPVRPSPTSRTRRPPPARLEAEDPDDASLARVLREILRKIGGRPDVSRIVGAHVARQQEPVAADAGVHRDVLFPVWPAERNRRADDARTDLEFPQLPARLRIGGFEPAVERPEEDDVTGRDDAAAPHGKLLLDSPHFATARSIPCDELAAVAARTD